MEKIACEIIKDLLPSYLDGVLSESVEEAVKFHLNECDSCKDALEELKLLRKQDEIAEEEKGRSFINKLTTYKHYLIGLCIGAAVPIIIFISFIIILLIMAYT